MPESSLISRIGMHNTFSHTNSKAFLVHEPIDQFNTWDDIRDGVCFDLSAFSLANVVPKLENEVDGVSFATVNHSNSFFKGEKLFDKVEKRLAQNREAARKSRLRKKAYVQRLEISRKKLIQLEHAIEKSRPQGSFLGEAQIDGSPDLDKNSGIMAFEIEYQNWVDEQNRQICELRTALNSNMNDLQLRILVDGVMNHYSELFRKKASVANMDVFYLVSEMWKTSTERLLSWIGGFRPSHVLKFMVGEVGEVREQQVMDICSLRESCQQAEDALSQGLEKLKLALSSLVGVGYTEQLERLQSLASFVEQADHVREECLQQMLGLLTMRQAASSLVAVGEYFQHVRELSSHWINRPQQPLPPPSL